MSDVLTGSPITAAERRTLRHPGERPALVIAGVLMVLTFLLVVLVLVALPIGGEQGEDVTALLDEVGLALLLPISLIFIRGMRRAEPRARGAAITAEQYPQLHEMIVAASKAMGLKRVPKAYLVADPSIEPCRKDYGMRSVVVIGTDFFAGCRENDQWEAMRFMVAHEVGHIAAGHGSYLRMMLTAMLVDVPVLGGVITRPQEYTADAYARRLHPEGGLRAVAAVATGKDNFPYVEAETMKEEATKRVGFFLWWTNLAGGHPIIPWRIHALVTPGAKGRVVWPPRAKG
ncbi:MAG: hypothetical protein Q4D96_08520 [Propionibacteriaceae bacterium]|nr:hypothetical protein [Propionibacteriaceae bacterium]